MTKITVTINTGFGIDKTYHCDVKIGSMTIMASNYIFPDNHPLPSDPSKTVLQDHEERLSAEGRNYYPMKYSEDISTIDQAISVAARIINDECNNPDLRAYEQPTYIINEDFRNRLNTKTTSKNKKSNYHPKDTETVTFERVESKPIQGDRITIKSGIREFPMLTVVNKNSILGIDATGLLLGISEDFLPLVEIENTGYIVTDVRTIKIEVDKYRTYTPPNKDLSWGRVPKSGTTSSIYDAHESVRKIFEYFDGRRMRGDIFLDQNLSDTYQSSKAALEAIEKLIDDLETF